MQPLACYRSSPKIVYSWYRSIITSGLLEAPTLSLLLYSPKFPASNNLKNNILYVTYVSERRGQHQENSLLCICMVVSTAVPNSHLLTALPAATDRPLCRPTHSCRRSPAINKA